MKKMMMTLMIIGYLSMGLKTNAGAQDAPVDNYVKYGEKYSCMINTTDGKSYLLDLEWSAEPSKLSTTPKWDEKLSYSLTENSAQIDSNLFSDWGFGHFEVELTFNYDKYIFAANSNFSTRIGTDSSDVHIEIKKVYDNNAKTVLSVVSFKSSHTFDRYYGTTKIQTVELAVLNSECVVTTNREQ